MSSIFFSPMAQLALTMFGGRLAHNVELAAVRQCGGRVLRGALGQACVLGRRSKYSKQTALGGIVKPNNDDEGN